MSAGMLRNWNKAKILKSKTPLSYFFAVQEFIYYELIVAKFNHKEKVKQFFDK